MERKVVGERNRNGRIALNNFSIETREKEVVEGE